MLIYSHLYLNFIKFMGKETAQHRQYIKAARKAVDLFIIHYNYDSIFLLYYTAPSSLYVISSLHTFLFYVVSNYVHEK